MAFGGGREHMSPAEAYEKDTFLKRVEALLT